MMNGDGLIITGSITGMYRDESECFVFITRIEAPNYRSFAPYMIMDLTQTVYKINIILITVSANSPADVKILLQPAVTKRFSNPSL